MNLDVASAVSTALAVIPGLRRFRSQLENSLKDFDLAWFDKIEDYTRAFSVANARYSTATSPADDLEGIYEEGRQLRELLHADARDASSAAVSLVLRLLGRDPDPVLGARFT